MTGEERDKLIRETTPYVCGAVNRAIRQFGRPIGCELEDLYSDAKLQMLRCLERYDASRGVPFKHFAAERVAGDIRDKLRGLQRDPIANSCELDIRMPAQDPSVSVKTSKKDSLLSQRLSKPVPTIFKCLHCGHVKGEHCNAVGCTHVSDGALCKCEGLVVSEVSAFKGEI